MKPKKKNGFISFLCIFLPGAAEMHVGLMKMGASMMLTFFACCAVASMCSGSELMLAFAFLMWFFGFFHAININGALPEELAVMEDYYIWRDFLGTEHKENEVKNKRILAAGLIVIGVCLLFSTVEDLVLRFIPEDLWEMLAPFVSRVPGIVISLLIIVFGIKMMAKAKKEMNISEEA